MAPDFPLFHGSSVLRIHWNPCSHIRHWQVVMAAVLHSEQPVHYGKVWEVRWKHGISVFWTLASCDRRVEQYTIQSVTLICNVMGGWLQLHYCTQHCHGSDVAHTLTIKLSPPSPGQPSPRSIVVISLNNHFEQFLSKQHLFCTSHFLPFVITTFDTS